MRAGMLVAAMCAGVMVGCGTPAGTGDAGTAPAVAPVAEAPAPEVAAPPTPAAPTAATPTPTQAPVRATGGAKPAPPPAKAAGASPAPASVAAPAAPAPAQAAPRAPAFRDITVPAGTALALSLKTTVSSESSTVNMPVRATLASAVVVDGVEVIPAGTELGGVVSNVAASGRVKGLAEVALEFTSVDVGGSTHDLRTEPVVRRAEATKGSDAKKVGIGAGAGAALGALLGGGKGAAKGAAVGTAAGAGVVLATKGKEARLELGSELRTALTAPLTLRVPR